jgi:hypothetical protein
MSWAVYIPILASAILGLTAKYFARGANPASMTRLIVAATVAISAFSAYAVFLLGCTLVGQVGFVATIGHWSAHTVSALDPVERSVAVAAVLALALASTMSCRLVIVRATAFLRAYRLGRQLSPAKGLAVVRDRKPLAYALPGGVYVVSNALLQALSPIERRVLLAHEAAHCRHGHHYWRAAAELSAAINPLLRPVVATVRILTERWADEAAAVSVGDRLATASALARAARLTQYWAAKPAFLAVGAGNVDDRVAALMSPPPRTSSWRVAVLIGLVAVVAVAAHIAGASLDTIFDSAANG